MKIEKVQNLLTASKIKLLTPRAYPFVYCAKLHISIYRTVTGFYHFVPNFSPCKDLKAPVNMASNCFIWRILYIALQDFVWWVSSSLSCLIKKLSSLRGFVTVKSSISDILDITLNSPQFSDSLSTPTKSIAFKIFF